MAEALRTRRVVVVGAGIGGLVSALLLAHRGLDVQLVEASPFPGGKIRQVYAGGVAVESGPTVFTMRWVFDQLLAEVGSSLERLVDLAPIHVLARHAWRGSTATLDLYSDTQRSADAIAAFSSPAEARRFTQFCQQTRALYQTLEQPYIRSQRPSLLSMAQDLGPRGLATLMGLGPFSTLWRSLGKHFHDPRLQQLFARYATYCGSSPWAAPATLMLVAQVELDGVWSVAGGMPALAQALTTLVHRHGVTLRFNRPCRKIETTNGQVSGVLLDNGERLPADAVVFNGDVGALAHGLLGPQVVSAVSPVPVAQRSLSALTWHVYAKTNGLPLVRHNVFFDRDYQSEFDDIFTRRRLPRRGTVYLCAQDRTDDGLARPGQERLLCLVNAPPDGDTRLANAREIHACETRSLALLRHCGLEIQAEPYQVVRTTPQQYASLYPGTGGALYGRATHGWMSAFARPSAQTALPGLYLAGGSVHPGPGVPMAAMSGRLAAATLMADLDSTSRSRRVLIAGGMSTP